VLIAPLDWGLGHATRCIPIIYTLLSLDYTIIIAADGATKNLLKSEFPDVVFTHLKGYNIRYSSKGSRLPLRLLVQFPGLVRSVFSEHQWLKAIVKEYKIDLVISDNRLGLYHSKIPCIYITHQLKIKTGSSFTTWLAQKLHYFFINRYYACWVPDNEFTNDLAGELSHPKKFPAVPVKYLGPLSRFEKISIEKKYHLLLLLSGPEPQRTILETLLLKETENFTGKILLVRGLPGVADNNLPLVNTIKNLTVVNHLTATALNTAVQQSDLVICRSGYTTIMDLVKLQQKAILIPTPGQTEQEYLAAYLMQQKIFFSVLQKDFSLSVALKNIASFPFKTDITPAEDYRTMITEQLQQFT
jgi:uncharacterized protein (TIGR00661 family)